jgi:hypothetical protein
VTGYSNERHHPNVSKSSNSRGLRASHDPTSNYPSPLEHKKEYLIYKHLETDLFNRDSNSRGARRRILFFIAPTAGAQPVD